MLNIILRDFNLFKDRTYCLAVGLASAVATTLAATQFAVTHHAIQAGCASVCDKMAQAAAYFAISPNTALTEKNALDLSKKVVAIAQACVSPFDPEAVCQTAYQQFQNILQITNHSATADGKLCNASINTLCETIGNEGKEFGVLMKTGIVFGGVLSILCAYRWRGRCCEPILISRCRRFLFG